MLSLLTSKVLSCTTQRTTSSVARSSHKRSYYRPHKPYKGRLLDRPIQEGMLRDPFREEKTAGDFFGKDLVRNMIRPPAHGSHQSIVDVEPFLGGAGGGHCGTLMTNIRASDNSLSLELMERFRDLVFKYASDNVLWTVVWKAYENHLCTGVDLYSIYAELHRTRSVKKIRQFYQHTYQVAYWLANLEKPMMPMLQGDVAGIGAGMALSAVFPLATDTSRVSLPGCRYGSLGPEGGALFKFSRLPGHIGEYLMISGKTLHSADLIHVGLASHFTPSDRAEVLHERLGAAHSSDLPTLLNCMDPVMDVPDDSTILQYLPSINRCFSHDSIAKIMKALEEETEHVEWAANTLASMRANSPLAMAITLEVTRLGRFLPLLNCLNLEYAAIARLVQHPEYTEGVSAFVESRTPKWTYATPEEVPVAEVNSFVQNLPIRKTLRLEKINPLAIRLDPAIERDRCAARLGFATIDPALLEGFEGGSTADLPETIAWAHAEILKPAGALAYHCLLDREDEMIDVIQDLNFDQTFSEMTHSTEG